LSAGAYVVVDAIAVRVGRTPMFRGIRIRFAVLRWTSVVAIVDAVAVRVWRAAVGTRIIGENSRYVGAGVIGIRDTVEIAIRGWRHLFFGLWSPLYAANCSEERRADAAIEARAESEAKPPVI